MLACAETLFAIALLVGLAIHCDVHAPLLGGVFLAPLLLLRTPDAAQHSARAFVQDGYGVKEYRDWPARTRRLVFAAAMVAGSLTAYLVLRWQYARGLAEVAPRDVLLIDAALLRSVWMLAVACVTSGLAVVVAVLGPGVGTAAATRTVAHGGKLIVALAIATVVLGGLALTFKDAVGHLAPQALLVVVAGGALGAIGVLIACAAVLVGAVLGTALGLVLRAALCQAAATLRHLPAALRRLPDNWLENTFKVDACLPTALLRSSKGEILTPLGLLRGTAHAQARHRVVRWLFAPGFAALCFLAARLYRLQLKATTWFWWPLAFLLRPQPAPRTRRKDAQRQALCWPWSDPWQRWLILITAFVPALLVCAILIDEHAGLGLWQRFNNTDTHALPAPLQLVLGMQWRRVPPWHWALLLMQLSGFGMLWISGGACSRHALGTWGDYARTRQLRVHLRRMRTLFRVRSLATIVLLLLGLGMCLISFPELHHHLPPALMQRLERFYRAQ